MRRGLSELEKGININHQFLSRIMFVLLKFILPFSCANRRRRLCAASDKKKDKSFLHETLSLRLIILPKREEER